MTHRTIMIWLIVGIIVNASGNIIGSQEMAIFGAGLWVPSMCAIIGIIWRTIRQQPQ